MLLLRRDGLLRKRCEKIEREGGTGQKVNKKCSGNKIHSFKTFQSLPKYEQYQVLNKVAKF